MTPTRLLLTAFGILTGAVLTHCAAGGQPAAVPQTAPVSSGTRLYIVGKLNRGAPVTVLFGSGAWSAVEMEADTVWVHANLVGTQAEAQSPWPATRLRRWIPA